MGLSLSNIAGYGYSRPTNLVCKTVDLATRELVAELID